MRNPGGSRIKWAGLSRSYWAWLVAVGLAMEGTALFYQYGLNRLPCSLCIHARIWTLALIVTGVLGFATGRFRIGRLIAGVLGVISAAGLLERSWRLLGTERAWYWGSCQNNAGLPDWFALDAWFPALFGVRDACGRTPELLFGVTMAEGLMVVSLMALVFGLLVLYGAIAPKRAGGLH